MHNPLDFLIIGAQKCATTTLFEHLRHHPSISMPIEKEVPFFTRPDCSPATWNDYAEKAFDACSKKLRGKATPQYMADPEVPAQLHQLMPGTKLIAILRDPIERTISHYYMAKRRGTETRSLEEAIATVLQPEVIHSNRYKKVPSHNDGYESESDFYLAWSEYGRSLRGFREFFPADQLLVIYMDDLAKQPEQTLDRILVYLGLAPGFRPASLGKVVHKGGSELRISQQLRQQIRNLPFISHLWNLVPPKKQGQLRFAYEQWNVKRHSQPSSPVLSENLRDVLVRHFSCDLTAIRDLGLEVPSWGGKYGL